MNARFGARILHGSCFLCRKESDCLKDNMKQRIAQVFSELLQEKPLEQITVKELTETLGISRIVPDQRCPPAYGENHRSVGIVFL